MAEGELLSKAVSRRNIEDGENAGCIWKLFSDDPHINKQSLKYSITFKDALSENVNLYIYDLNMNQKVQDAKLLQAKAKSKPFSINYLDYNSSEVYMMAVQEREHVHHIKLEFDIQYVEVFPLSAGQIFIIIFFIMIFMAIAGAALVLWLNKIGVISIYVPKKIRVFCLKNYMSAEEREIYGHEAQVTDIIHNAKELNQRSQI